jgi:hypothetical protein
MDKGRHPHVIRTWTVERTKVPNRSQFPQTASPNWRRDLFRGSERNPPKGGSAPKRGR